MQSHCIQFHPAGVTDAYPGDSKCAVSLTKHADLNLLIIEIESLVIAPKLKINTTASIFRIPVKIQ